MVDQINDQSSKKSYQWDYCQDDDPSGLDHHALSLLADSVNFDDILHNNKESSSLIQDSNELNNIDTSNNPRHHHNHHHHHQHLNQPQQHHHHHYQQEPHHSHHQYHHMRSLERDTHPDRRPYVGSVSDSVGVSFFSDLITGFQEVKFSQTRAFTAGLSANTVGQSCDSPAISPPAYHGNQSDILSPALIPVSPSQSPNQSNWISTNNSSSGNSNGSRSSLNNIDSKVSSHIRRDQHQPYLQRQPLHIHQISKPNIIDKHRQQNQQSEYFTSSLECPVSPESSKVAYSAYNSDSNLGNGGSDTPTLNDADMSSLNCDMGNSDDCLNIAGESDSMSFMRSSSKNSKKSLDKGSDEYKKRRERNNVAVRKSREKAKQRSRDTEKKVVELQNENESLRRKVDELSGKMMILRRLLDNVGVTQACIDDEINCALQEAHRSRSDY